MSEIYPTRAIHMGEDARLGAVSVTSLTVGGVATSPLAPVASGGAAPAGGTGATVGAYDTAAHRDALITLVNTIRTALIANGTLS
jgi:hypothetical protein